ncbi:MAG: cell division protein FtsL [Treponema sp.]|nr:cell division protein FtsL [Spirochaetia bacterium]MDD7013524.1 cell division protein FtsL [Spirochaetales bacterium]MDY4902978.1 cell division protein FtsL [Treponema sp.]
MKFKEVMRLIYAVILAAAIPGLLVLNGFQARKYKKLQEEVNSIVKKQEELTEDNKKLITDRSQLTSSQRIEDLAENELGMRRAETEEIIRVSVGEEK